MNFGQALEEVKKGNLVAREGWNGKNMFIFQRPEDRLPKTIIEKMISIPESVRPVLLNILENEEISYIKFTAYLCMKAADNTIVNGWLASQTDMLAEDWVLL